MTILPFRPPSECWKMSRTFFIFKYKKGENWRRNLLPNIFVPDRRRSLDSSRNLPPVSHNLRSPKHAMPLCLRPSFSSYVYSQRFVSQYVTSKWQSSVDGKCKGWANGQLWFPNITGLDRRTMYPWEEPEEVKIMSSFSCCQRRQEVAPDLSQVFMPHKAHSSFQFFCGVDFQEDD